MISAVVLTAGCGEGMFPFSTVRNKVALPVLDTAIILRLVQQLKEVGIGDITVVTGYYEQSIRYALRDVEGITFQKQKDGGTSSDAIRSVLNTFCSDETMIFYGDIVTTKDNLSRFIKTHKDYGSEISILVSNQKPSPLHTVFVEKDTNDKLLRLVFDRDSPAYWFAGVLLGKTSSLKEYFDIEPGIVRSVPLGGMPVPEGNLISAIDVMLEKHCEVSCILAEDFVVDVDHPWDLIEANQRAMQEIFHKIDKPIIGKSVVISEGAEISSNAKLWVSEGGRIGKGTVIKGNLFLGKGSHISNGAILEEDIYVGANTVISEYAKVHKNSVIGEHNLVLHDAEFYGLTLDTVFMVHTCCISGMIGSHVDIGAGTISATWRFDNKVKQIRCKQREETPPYHGNMTYLGDYCRTGINVMFMPGVRIGAYSCIGPGVIVNNDIEPYSLVIQKQDLEIKPWGPDRYP